MKAAVITAMVPAIAAASIGCRSTPSQPDPSRMTEASI